MDEELANEEKEAFVSQAGGLYRGEGRALKVQNSGVKGFLRKRAPLIAVVIFLVVLTILVPLVPSILIGTIKENLLGALGFKDTIAILEEQAEYVVSEKLALGEVPAGLAEDLLAQGIEVGQVTLAGDFVRTNTYIADIDGVVAAEGEYQSQGTGELSIRFNGEIVAADDFVAKVEADPVMYAAYSEALNISARYYYSDAVNAVYKGMGINRGSFNAWSSGGNAAEDQGSFDETLEKTLDKESNRNISGQYLYWYRRCVTNKDGSKTCWWENRPVQWECSGGGSSWKCNYSDDGNVSLTEIAGDSDKVAADLVNYVATHSRDDNSGLTAEENAAQILSTVLSADEPYRAASDFMTLMEAIERAQVDGDGPVNEMMNLLSTPQEVSYVDINTGGVVTENRSILETHNFKVALGGGEFSKGEANNFARDRILVATNTTRENSITSIPLSTNGKSKSGDGLDMKNDIYSCSGEQTTCKNNRSASLDNIESVISAMKIGMADANSENFGSVVGANRILEGGSFISNTINQQVIGAMPSDGAQVASYRQEVNEVLARQAAAERATKSPLDISSPYTFMGSLVRKMAVTTLSNYDSGSGGSVASSILGSVAQLAGNSMKSLFGAATAEGSEEAFTTVSGECLVVSTTGATCDLYGTAHNTVYTGYMNYRESDWARAIDEEEAEDFAENGMKREATVGIKSYEVCSESKKEKDESEEGGILDKVKGFFGKVVELARKIVSVVTGAGALNEGCSGVDEEIATGSKYVLHGGQVDETAKMSGYALYSTVSSLLDDSNRAETAFAK